MVTKNMISLAGCNTIFEQFGSG